MRAPPPQKHLLRSKEAPVRMTWGSASVRPLRPVASLLLGLCLRLLLCPQC